MDLQLNAVASGDQLQSAARARQALAVAGAWILNHHSFSNLSISISFAIEPARLPRLIAELDSAGISLMASSRARASEVAAIPGELQASLQITFFHNQPDLRDHIPAVPG